MPLENFRALVLRQQGKTAALEHASKGAYDPNTRDASCGTLMSARAVC